MEKRSGKISRKSEVRSPKPETQDSAFHIPQSEIEHPKSEMEKKSKVGSPKSELKKKSEKENTSASDNYRDDTSHSEIETLPTANSKLQTENTMEVHHHPRLDHSPKPWKEYLLEGLMIFLAVTMGFFAETIRENISDTAKGKEYIKSFVQDLRTDTADFSILIAYEEKKTQGLSGLSACYDAIRNDPQATSCLVPLARNSSSNRHVGFVDGTMQQLKNAGGFRLLSRDDKDSIVAYDHAIGSYKDFETTVFQERQNIVRAAFVKLMNFKSVELLLPGSPKNHVEAPILFFNDKALLNEYFIDLFLYQKVGINQGVIIKGLKIRAAGLIKYFENKYDLKK